MCERSVHRQADQKHLADELMIYLEIFLNRFAHMMLTALKWRTLYASCGVMFVTLILGRVARQKNIPATLLTQDLGSLTLNQSQNIY